MYIELINDFEASNLKQGSRTPHFYGLPKIHKEYITFPPLRPICSEFNSCTAKISEFIDAYLKPLAQNTSSYIKDTSDFVERIESDVAPTTISSKTISSKTILVHVPNFGGLSGSEDRGGGDNSIQFINFGRVGDKSFKE